MTQPQVGQGDWWQQQAQNKIKDLEFQIEEIEKLAYTADPKEQATRQSLITQFRRSIKAIEDGGF